MAKKEPKELMKVEPSRAVSPFDEMERWFEDVFRRPAWWPRLRMPEAEEMMPAVDIFTEGDSVVVKAELPGIKKEDLDVSVTDEMITISGEKKREEKVEKKDYYRIERSHGSFSRSFRVPAGVDTGKAKAQFKDGILEIRMPKLEGAREKKISVE